MEGRIVKDLKTTPRLVLQLIVSLAERFSGDGDPSERVCEFNLFLWTGLLDLSVRLVAVICDVFLIVARATSTGL